MTSWSGFSSAWERATSITHAASSLSELAERASEKLAATSERLAETSAADLWATAATAAASAADGAGVLARKSKLQGELKLLESNVIAWKREWGQESFDAFFAGDLAAVSVNLYKCRAEIAKIHDMMAAKRCEMRGLDAFGLSYDAVLHGAMRRWRTVLSARRKVHSRRATVIAKDSEPLRLRCALRTWRRLLVDRSSPSKQAVGPLPTATGSTTDRPTALGYSAVESGLMVPD